ncbi:membrane-bound lytic murein transglycosylase MltF [Aurantivibrio plasticivorans]
MVVSGVLKNVSRLALAAALCIPLVKSHVPTTLDNVLNNNVLHIISRNGPTTFYEGPHGMAGFEYVMAKAFAEDLGVELQIHNVDNLGELIDNVSLAKQHLGASGLTITESRQTRVKFAAPYLNVTQQLIFNSRTEQPESLSDIEGKRIVVVANSSHAENLRELKEDFPNLEWEEISDVEMIDLLEMVHNGKADYAVVDSNAYQFNRNIFPRAKAAFDISEPQQLAWIFPKRNDATLYNAAQDFFAKIEDDGRLEQYVTQHFGKKDKVNRGGALLFANRIENRLPRWRPFLEEAGKEHNLDWQLLAAISYQESHWNARARSHTGVRGLMMLTQATAKDMGISNRVDPQQSIKGGAKYFKKIFDRIPDQIQGRDRTWMALAAYNVGMGHLEDARILTEHFGFNPNKWDDVAKHLPLLAKRKYYKSMKHGYARGWEPVAYVENIRNYYNVLAWHSQTEDRRLAAAKRDDSEFQAVNEKATRLDRVSLAL